MDDWLLTCVLNPCSPVYKRIGIVGNLAMLRREAAAYAAAAEERGPGDPGEGVGAWGERRLALGIVRSCVPGKRRDCL